ncbi:MAG: helix-turn-helix domain-containing protein [Terriglobales bacterium]
MSLEKLYSVEEAAKALGISHWTIWAKLKNGEVMRTKIGGRTVIRESELKKLIIDQPPKGRNRLLNEEALTVEA